MRRSALILAVAAALFSLGCGATPGSLSKTRPREDKILERVRQAECKYAALHFENSYNWTIDLFYVNPRDLLVGRVLAAGDKIFCIEEDNLLYNNQLFLRMRSVQNSDRRSGVIVYFPFEVQEGDVLRLTVHSTSLDNWQTLLLPYTLEKTEPEKPESVSAK